MVSKPSQILFTKPIHILYKICFVFYFQFIILTIGASVFLKACSGISNHYFTMFCVKTLSPLYFHPLLLILSVLQIYLAKFPFSPSYLSSYLVILSYFLPFYYFISSSFCHLHHHLFPPQDSFLVCYSVIWHPLELGEVIPTVHGAYLMGAHLWCMVLARICL